MDSMLPQLITAIRTPYSLKGGIDWQRLAHLLDRQIAAGIRAVVMAGTTGDGHLLDSDMILSLIAFAAQYAPGQLSVIGYTGHMQTGKALRLTEAGFACGMQASLQINPYYGHTTKEGLLTHFQALLALGPTLIYNVPSRTAQDITPDLIQKLSGHDHFIGIKECHSSERIAAYRRLGIAVWNGNDQQAFHDCCDLQATGTISVLSNLLPKTISQVFTRRDLKLWQSLLPLLNWLGKYPNPIAIYHLMVSADLILPVMRLPYCPLDDKQLRPLKTMLPAIAAAEGIDIAVDLKPIWQMIG